MNIRRLSGSYFEHVIRDDKSLDRIREYISMNPERWQHDKENAPQKRPDEFDKWLSSAGMQPVTRR